MKKVIVIALIFILTVTIVYYKDFLIDFKNDFFSYVVINMNHLIDSIPLKIKIDYHNSSWILSEIDRLGKYKDSPVLVLSVPIYTSYINSILFKDWMPYEKLEVFKKRGKLYIYYDEINLNKKGKSEISNSTQKESCEISFRLSFRVDKDNIILFKNGKRIDTFEVIYRGLTF